MFKTSTEGKILEQVIKSPTLQPERILESQHAFFEKSYSQLISSWQSAQFNHLQSFVRDLLNEDLGNSVSRIDEFNRCIAALGASETVSLEKGEIHVSATNISLPFNEYTADEVTHSLWRVFGFDHTFIKPHHPEQILLEETHFQRELLELYHHQVDQEYVNDALRGNIEIHHYTPQQINDIGFGDRHFRGHDTVNLNLALYILAESTSAFYDATNRQVFSSDTVLYRGSNGFSLKGKDGSMEKEVGDVVTFRGFTSFSTDLAGIANIFYEGVLYELTAPKGMGHIPMSNVDLTNGKKTRTSNAEFEFVIPPQDYEIKAIGKKFIEAVGKEMFVVSLSPLFYQNGTTQS